MYHSLSSNSRVVSLVWTVLPSLQMLCSPAGGHWRMSVGLEDLHNNTAAVSLCTLTAEQRLGTSPATQHSAQNVLNCTQSLLRRSYK
jgi:hypothetical protein